MRTHRVLVGVASVVVGASVATFARQATQVPADKPTSAAPAASASEKQPAILDHTMKRIDGTEESLKTYHGKVVIIVNVASKCGYTKQYAALEALFKKHKDDGLVVLGFPANNFGSQEPGTNAEVAKFCTDTYGVTFPMFEKINVKGDDSHSLYKQLAGLPEPLGGEPKWNFTKFVLDRQGAVVARFDPKGNKGDRAALEEGLEAKVEELLKAAAPGAPQSPESQDKK
jgi:glutathione peroxidase